MTNSNYYDHSNYRRVEKLNDGNLISGEDEKF